MKILIIRFSSIGDIVLTSPVITAIKEEFPDSQIHFLTKKSFQDILMHNPSINKIWCYEKNHLFSLIQQLTKEKFDYVLDLHNNLRSRWVSLWLRKKTFRLDKQNWNKWKMVNCKCKIVIPHIVERYFATLLNMDKNFTVPKSLTYYCGEEANQEAKRILAQHSLTNYIAIVLSATHVTKKWLKEYYVELIHSLNYPVILLGGRTEVEEGKWIYNQLKNPSFVFNLCGTTSLNVSASLLKYSDLVITHDTGMMHIACAFQKKIIVIWGNTCPEIGFAPYQNPHAVNISLNLPCKPCSKLGKNHCPKEHFDCMKKISPNTVLKAIQEIL